VTDDSTGGPDGDWEAVFLDIGGVLLALESVASAQRAFVERFVEAYGVDLPMEEALETWRGAAGDHFHEREGTDYRAGRIAYAKGVRAVLGVDPPDDDWREMLREAFLEHRRPVHGAVETVEALAGTDLHVGVVSDIDADEAEEILRGFGIHDQFDAVTTSEEVGRTKPDPAMFETALEKAGSDPARTLMVGDRYEHDMAGAADLGIRTAAHGADDGPAVDHVLDDIREVLDVVGGERTGAR
jgi:putative hydrolase of the HAD superfamily